MIMPPQSNNGDIHCSLDACLRFVSVLVGKPASSLLSRQLAGWLSNTHMQAEKNGSVRPTAGVNPTGSPASDLCCDYPMPIRGIPLTPHQSIRTMVIPSHEMTTCQHHSDVVLQSHAISLMRCNITCSLDLFYSD